MTAPRHGAYPDDGQLAFDLGPELGPGAGSAPEPLEQHREIELKFTVSTDEPLPRLDTLLPEIAAVGPETEFEMVALYFDTPELDLIRAGGSLRRRAGGTDEGWHLKTAGEGPGNRIELRAPLRGEVPPESLMGRLPVSARADRLAAVAELVTLRKLSTLLDEAGQVLAEVCDDTVQVHLPSNRDSLPSWREIEVELVVGSGELLDRVGKALVAWGAQPATYGSKVARALGEPKPMGPARSS